MAEKNFMSDAIQHLTVQPYQIRELFPLVVYTAMAVLLVGGLLFAAGLLGEKRKGEVKESAYESGVKPSGSARLAYPVPFYLVAIFFIVFDVESVFIFIWAVDWDTLGMLGLIHISVFILVLLLGLCWLWKKGGLDWGPSREYGKGSPPQSGA